MWHKNSIGDLISNKVATKKIRTTSSKSSKSKNGDTISETYDTMSAISKKNRYP